MWSGWCWSGSGWTAAGAACHASATQRHAVCLRGQPLPPLNTWNNYAYVGGNPISLIDPEGLVGTTVDKYCLTHPAECAAIGAGARGVAREVAKSARSDSSSQVELDRAIHQPDRNPGRWTCVARADCNDNIPGNCPENPKHRFAFGGGVAPDQGIARNIAKANATSNLQCQPKHVSCKCTGPKGEVYSGGC